MVQHGAFEPVRDVLLCRQHCSDVVISIRGCALKMDFSLQWRVLPLAPSSLFVRVIREDFSTSLDSVSKQMFDWSPNTFT